MWLGRRGYNSLSRGSVINFRIIAGAAQTGAVLSYGNTASGQSGFEALGNYSGLT